MTAIQLEVAVIQVTDERNVSEVLTAAGKAPPLTGVGLLDREE